MSIRRKIAIASWDGPREGNIYVKLQFDVEPALAYLAKQSEKTNEKLTITHFVGKILGKVLAERPDLNGRIVFGRYKKLEEVSLSFLVQMDDGHDLGKVKVKNIHKKSLLEVGQALKKGSKA